MIDILTKTVLYSYYHKAKFCKAGQGDYPVVLVMIILGIIDNTTGKVIFIVWKK
jgi:hypothetical protein